MAFRFILSTSSIVVSSVAEICVFAPFVEKAVATFPFARLSTRSLGYCGKEIYEMKSNNQMIFLRYP